MHVCVSLACKDENKHNIVHAYTHAFMQASMHASHRAHSFTSSMQDANMTSSCGTNSISAHDGQRAWVHISYISNNAGRLCVFLGLLVQLVWATSWS